MDEFGNQQSAVRVLTPRRDTNDRVARVLEMFATWTFDEMKVACLKANAINDKLAWIEYAELFSALGQNNAKD